MKWDEFDWLLEAALREDRAGEDVTSRALVPQDLAARAEVLAKQEGIICGLPLAARLAGRFDPSMTFEGVVEDGTAVRPGDILALLHGRATSILAVERSMLNVLQHLSGVATLTRRFVDAIAGTRAQIYDTRKTTPGWRALEKYAVTCGGGRNHRMGLHDQVLIKDNHMEALAGGGAEGGRTAQAIAEAVGRARERCAPSLQIEVEVEDEEQLKAAVSAGADIIMLDNMSPQEAARAMEVVQALRPDDPPAVEASGRITLANVRPYAEAGVDRISIGALTHSAPALDISVELR